MMASELIIKSPNNSSIPSLVKVRPQALSAQADQSAAPTGVSPQRDPNITEPQPPPREQLEQAVSRINDFVQNVQRSLLFAVDDATGKTVITVTDRDTEQVVRKIPSEEVLALAENLQELQGKLFTGEA